jgi:hypothetical protein
MKKLFLLLLTVSLSVTNFSCSGDDNADAVNNTPANVLTMKVNGVQKSFNTFNVDDNSNGTVNWVSVQGSQNGSLSEEINFQIDGNGAVGQGAFTSFDYIAGDKTYAAAYETGEFTMNVITNNNSRLRGTFSGVLKYYNIDTQQVETATVTEGTFDITR